MANRTVGLDDHILKVRSLAEDTEPAAIMYMLQMGELVRQDIMASIANGTIRGPGHVPSRPGDPPKGDTGRLELSVDVVLRRSEKSVIVVARAPHAAAMEFGTSNVLARPFMRPAMRRHKSKIVYGIVSIFSGEGVRVYKSSPRSIGAASHMNGGQMYVKGR